MQNITIVGRLGRDAVIRESSTGSRFVTMTVAANAKKQNVEKTSWYEVTTFNVERLEKMVPYLTKGSSVIVVGELDASIQTGSDGVQRLRLLVNADRVDFNSNSSSGNTKTVTEAVAPDTAPEPEAAPDEIPVIATKKGKKTTQPKEEPKVDNSDDDDLPF
jgi:single stranded DNA-binding protein